MALKINLHRFEGPTGASSYRLRGAGEDTGHSAGASLRWYGPGTGQRGRKLLGEATAMSQPVLPAARFSTQAYTIPLVSGVLSGAVGPGLDEVVGNGNGPRYGQLPTVSRQG